jgi:elongation factor Ts
LKGINMALSASMVKELREKSGAGMMDCKKALSETNGNMDAAVDWLIVRFGNKASKAASRVAAEGVIGSYISSDRLNGSIIEVNSETDFCAKNEEFLGFVEKLAKVVVDKKLSEIDELPNGLIGEVNVEEIRTQLIGKIGENITPRRTFSINTI